MNFKQTIAAAATAAFLIGAGAAQATTVTVTPGGAWTNPAGENGDGTGSSAITNTVARDGNGSIELHGDRTRFVLGDLYSPASNLGALSNFSDLAFDWRIAGDSVGKLDPDYSPALRMTFWYNNGGTMTKDEFVWEAAYNGLYGAQTVPDTWYSTNSSSTFYLKSLNNENNEKTLAQWLNGYGSDAYVSAIYIGVGSSAGKDYHAFADNVVANGTTYNFETPGGNGNGVPEPATWAMMVLGFGAVGSLVRGQRRRQAA